MDFYLCLELIVFNLLFPQGLDSLLSLFLLCQIFEPSLLLLPLNILAVLQRLFDLLFVELFLSFLPLELILERHYGLV